MGEVWRGLDVQLSRSVAVKILPLPVATNPADVARFRREAQVGAGLSHPGITAVFDIGEHREQDDRWLFFVMELLVGRDLRHLLTASPEGLPIEQVRELAAQAADALAVAHRHGVVHRDIKPANLFLAEDGRVKICDFGIAHLADATRLTSTGQAAGTPLYMAPEQIQGRQVDHRTDLYAFGCVLYELLTGRSWIRTDTNVGAILYHHIDQQPAPPRSLRPQIPVALDELVLELLAKDPDHRPADAASVAERLRRLPDGLSLPDVPPPPPVPPYTPYTPTQPVPAPRRLGRRGLVLGGLGAAALVGVPTTVLLLGPDKGKDTSGNKGEDSGSGAQAGKVGAGQTVTMGYIPWDEGIATTYLWKVLLERRGYHVNLKQFDTALLFSAVASGTVDFHTDAWLPTTHQTYWDKYRSRLDDLGSWDARTSLELTVPSYVEDVDSLADLKGRADTFGGRVVGIEPAAGMMTLLNGKVLDAYGLKDEYEVASSSTASMLTELDRSVRNHEPIVVTLWSPHWAYAKYDLKKLKDPKGSWGKGDQIHTVARKGFAAKAPTVAGWLRNFKLDDQQIDGLENAIQAVGSGREEDGVKSWLAENPGMVDKLAPVPDGSAGEG
ncbi:glycine betaine ABC transporter substrate-binding protein [Streptomyces odontomachi]|uniref:glycine betaine ABC transporter substrate-binding protein n=1 Tax=Streptomyces odontomachi TaxID=2944940 RepID=UPI0027E397E5|nr:glycine betaine ABC transporter substrate-binding protein [Streptomyces sp. ODS25]